MGEKKHKVPTVPEYRRFEATRGMDFEPQTPRDSTRFEMQHRGVLRPGKTEQDYMRTDARPRVKEWQRRQARMLEPELREAV